MQVLFHMLITKNIFTRHAMRASAPKPLRGLLISCPPVNLAGEVLVGHFAHFLQKSHSFSRRVQRACFNFDFLMALINCPNTVSLCILMKNNFCVFLNQIYQNIST